MQQNKVWPGRIRSARLFLIGLLCLLPLMAAAQTTPPVATVGPSPAPLLRIETGMHTSSIHQIGTDLQGRYLVTGSDDKTVRVWDAATGTALTTIRPPLGAGEEGKISGVALSPDGQTVACGGYTGYSWDKSISLYFFDRASGRLLKRLFGLPNVILHVAYSPDGKYLAASLVSGGLVIIQVSDYSVLAVDADYGAASYGVAFSSGPGPRKVVTSCWDGFVRLYTLGAGDTKTTLVAKSKISGVTKPYEVAFSPDGAHIAVGIADTIKVAVLSAQDLSLQYGQSLTAPPGSGLECVCWSADGKFLYASGSARGDTGKHSLLRFSNAGHGDLETVPIANDTVYDLLPRSGGGVYFGSGVPNFGAVDGGNQVLFTQKPQIADLRGNYDGFRVSRDGFTVEFNSIYLANAPALFSLIGRALTLKPAADISTPLAAPITAAPGLTVTDWKQSAKPLLNGKPLALREAEIARSLAITPDQQAFLLGSEFGLRLLEKDGTRKWYIPTSDPVWGVNVSGDGKVAVAALGDGTIRWFRMTDGQQLAAFFPHADKKRWIVWMPSGYFDCSPGGEDLIGWHINRGRDQSADFFPASRLRSTFYRPDVLAQVTTTLNGKDALRLADAASGRTTQVADVQAKLPPVVSILSPNGGDAVSASTVTVKFTVRTPSGQPVTEIKVLVDGQAVPDTRRIELTAEDTNTTDGAARTIDVPIPARDCTVSLIASNQFASSEAASVSLHWQGAAPTARDLEFKPTLYLLAVGVGDYQDATIPKLHFTVKDTTDFVSVMKRQKGTLYADVVVKVLTDADATRDNIVDGLDWLKHQTTQHDVAMIFLSGHGANDEDGDYLFIPVNFKREAVSRTGLSYAVLKKTIADIAGKKLLFVDSCHSGGVMGRQKAVDITGAVNELSSAENGAVVFSASTGRQSSQESDEWHNGAFTKALVDGLGGKADLKGRHLITIKALDFYVSDAVKELTHGEQSPTTTLPQAVQDYPIAISP